MIYQPARIAGVLLLSEIINRFVLIKLVSLTPGFFSKLKYATLPSWHSCLVFRYRKTYTW